ncbi:MAG: hypothetical protein EAZ85_05055 [Bacteroidetes bacterium]|nr:MAG: hypothetical protein EAZ85_05055 [Bacteroidota bacterium]
MKKLIILGVIYLFLVIGCKKNNQEQPIPQKKDISKKVSPSRSIRNMEDAAYLHNLVIQKAITKYSDSNQVNFTNYEDFRNEIDQFSFNSMKELCGLDSATIKGIEQEKNNRNNQNDVRYQITKKGFTKFVDENVYPMLENLKNDTKISQKEVDMVHKLLEEIKVSNHKIRNSDGTLNQQEIQKLGIFLNAMKDEYQKEQFDLEANQGVIAGYGIYIGLNSYKLFLENGDIDLIIPLPSENNEIMVAPWIIDLGGGIIGAGIAYHKGADMFEGAFWGCLFNSAGAARLIGRGAIRLLTGK